VKLAKQVESDLLWIRQEFLSTTKPFEKFVVHGHTPVANPDIQAEDVEIRSTAEHAGERPSWRRSLRGWPGEDQHRPVVYGTCIAA
jgi:hypothetical protein